MAASLRLAPRPLIWTATCPLLLATGYLLLATCYLLLDHLPLFHSAIRYLFGRFFVMLVGSLSNSAPWYSQGVRQAIRKLHSDSPGVVFKVSLSCHVPYTPTPISHTLPRPCHVHSHAPHLAMACHIVPHRIASYHIIPHHIACIPAPYPSPTCISPEPYLTTDY